MIVCSILPRDPAAALAAMRQAGAAGADAVELRCDLLEAADLRAILAGKPLPVIVACRPAWEGGRWRGTEGDRVGLLEEACLLGADYVDVEFKAYKDFPRREAKLIVSWHDFEATPEDLDGLLARMAALEPLVSKLAVTPRSAADAARLVEAQKRAQAPAACVPMGDFGEALRPLHVRYGGFLTYASLGPGAETAPGQPSIEELVRDYRAKTVDDETKVYAVLGDPVAHSRGPAVFNRLFRDLGLNARYVRIRVDDGRRLRDVIRAWELCGASVTAPLKEDARREVDEVDGTAEAAGAVNTIVAREGRLVGANTDAAGAVGEILDAARRKWRHGVYGLRALVLGTGGAARAIAHGLAAEGARVIVAGRTPERARALAESVGGDFLQLSRLIEARAQVICNATPVGMGADESLFPKELWKADCVAFDAVYTPRATRFLREAAEAGAETADGVGMFLRQADGQAKLFLGRGFPAELLNEFRRRM